MATVEDETVSLCDSESDTEQQDDISSSTTVVQSRAASCVMLALRLALSWRHALHCLLMATFVVGFMAIVGALRLSDKVDFSIDPWLEYGVISTVFLYLLRFISILCVPQVLFNACGLLWYDTFPARVQLKGSPLLAPFLCVRVVTRGNFPQLVRTNVQRNLATCLSAGLENFMLEVVTDRAVGLERGSRLRELVVPASYRTKSGALFKARALQYCLEPDVNVLQSEDWVLHLDEETLITENAARGVLNFMLDGRHQFGQGLITYANEHVVNWITTLADSFRVAEDMGKLRFQLRFLHRPLFSWKGSYVLTQLGAEQKVSYDNGPDGSIAEDCYFAMSAMQQGYSFDFVEGEMWEKSPFTLWDFLQQRKRWMQGIWLVVHSPEIQWRTKALLAVSLYSWVTLPLSTCLLVVGPQYPLATPQALDALSALVGAVNLYQYAFGAIKSFNLRRMGWRRMTCGALAAVCTVPLNVVIENVAVIWGLFGSKHQFYVVNKQVPNARPLDTLHV